MVPAIHWKPVPEQGHTIVAIHTWDREQLLPKIAGSFSVVPLNILSVDTFTRGDHTALNLFHVCDMKGRAVTDERDCGLVEKTLRNALEKETFDFGPKIEKARQQMRHRPSQDLEFPTHISVDNKAHPAFTLIQIQTPDRIGLLYDLLSCLGREGVAIALSRISARTAPRLTCLCYGQHDARRKLPTRGRIAALQSKLQTTTLGPKPG